MPHTFKSKFTLPLAVFSMACDVYGYGQDLKALKIKSLFLNRQDGLQVVEN
jgi:hypothetical protein